MIEGDWRNCHGKSWGKEIVPEAYSHPAKAARNLARRIYEHALAEGWLKAGDTVIDPFAGICGLAYHALQHGINFVGVELERPFHDLSTGVDCTGITKADWVRFHGRWDKARYLEDRHWCPRCMAETAITLPPKSAQMAMFPDVLTASYRRNSGTIPHTEPHHYVGNLELFARHSRNGAQAVCLLGDSRELAEVLAQGFANACISSPPYIGSLKGQDDTEARVERLKKLGHLKTRGNWGGVNQAQGITSSDGYSDGSHPAQLGNMREGEFSAVVSSPPYAESLSNPSTKIEHTGAGGPIHPRHYGFDEGQLAAMPEGQFDMALSSPPYAGSPVAKCEGDMAGKWRETGQTPRQRSSDGKLTSEQYGDTPGNLAQLPEGDVRACISSPPYERSIDSGFSGIDWDKANQARQDGPRQSLKAPLKDYEFRYGKCDGQLGQESGPTFWSAARAIAQQVYQVLAPGGVAIWIVKAFVRNKAIVDFPGQWRELCESAGFVTMHQHRAWLIEDRGTQVGLDGELNHRTVKRSSFFRRLHEKKYPHLAIDFEVILCQQKP